MGRLGDGTAKGDDVSLGPLVRSSRKPPVDWARVEIEGDSLVVRLAGWRAVWAVKRTLRLPVSSIVNVSLDSGAYQQISTRLRKSRRPPSLLFKLGSQHGYDGWSFWASGWGRSTVVVEMTGIRYHFLVVEVSDPVRLVKMLREAAGLETKTKQDKSTDRSPEDG